jgi:hypothetical protein
MKKLIIHLAYDSSVSSQFRRGSSLGIALPVKVLDADGTIIADGLTSLQQPAKFSLPDALQTVFVRLSCPSGKTETQKVILLLNTPAIVTFSDARIARNEWFAWAIPLLNLRTSHNLVERPDGASLEAYLKVWLRVWQFKEGDWHLTPIDPRMQYKNEVARQVDLELDAKPHLLQVGGSNVPWRFVALPTAGPCRVLLTPNDSKDPRADPLKILVTSYRNDAETLLEFLARDAVRAANTMANSVEMAVSLFGEKFEDPIAAVAGAYYLLRIEDAERVPLLWWQNLSRNFSWIPDTAILHCVYLLRLGLEDERARNEAIDLFKACLNRGWPVYEEGLHLLQEAGSLLRHIADRRDADFFARVESLATAKTWTGAALSFYGKDPSEPSAVLWVGMPNAPRRRRLTRPEWVGEVIEKNRKVIEDPNQLIASKVSRQISSLAFARELVAQRTLIDDTESQREHSVPRLESFEKSVGHLHENRPSSAATESMMKARKDKQHGSWLLLGDIGN